MNLAPHARLTQLSPPVLLLITAMLAGCGTAPVDPNHRAAFSGNELSTGKRIGDAVSGAIFAGTDNSACNCWSDNSTGGTWIASINYSG